jgi:hypothetical protein
MQDLTITKAKDFHHNNIARQQGRSQGSSIFFCSSNAGPSSTEMTRSLQQGLGVFSPSDTTDNGSSFFSGGRQLFDSIKVGKINKLQAMFACRIHCKATPYSAVSHPALKDFHMH